jgi:ubiquinone/menaquinone biosynthesis C-methylase UbiE
LNIDDYIAAKSAYNDGQNVTNYLKRRLGIDFTTPKIIATAYDLQAGYYSDHAESNPIFYRERSEEVASFIHSNINNITSVLDVGTGELTMFSRVASILSAASDIDFFATDISLSRLLVGRKRLNPLFNIVADLKLVVADTAMLPFATSSIDLITTDHSLEPNGSRLEKLVRECFRVSRRYCVFVEPSNRLQDSAGVERMRSLGYIFDLEKTIDKLGGKILAQHNTVNNYNDLNKSKMIIVEVPISNKSSEINSKLRYHYTYPGTNYFLEISGNFYFCRKSGFLFPAVDDVPVLLEQNRILCSRFPI